MSLMDVPLWAWASALLLLAGVALGLQPVSTRLRLVGLALCQVGVFCACLWGWGVVTHGTTQVAPPTAKAACWVLGVLMILTFLSAWVLGRRPWAEGLLASRSPKPGYRRQL